MDFNYTKIKFGNWLFKNCFPLYNFTYRRFKLKNDRTEIEVLRRIIKPGDHILDIGANIGFYAELLSDMTGPTGQVYCFEPDSVNFRYLLKNTKGLKNVTLFNKAVSSEKGTLKVYKSKLLNVDHRTYPVNNYDSIEEIESVSIDDLLEQGTIKSVQVIKIDIQGFELSAFAGMKKLLSAKENLKVVAEYWPHGFKRAGVSAIAFYDFFDNLGYTFTILEDSGERPLTRDYVVQNNDQPFEFSFNVLIEKS
ncbi:MAG: FkbM family methyltransferase [Bacteroidia bacterium]|nr:FkbM family methyltransferase [Bacteroidia bacterium]